MLKTAARHPRGQRHLSDAARVHQADSRRRSSFRLVKFVESWTCLSSRPSRAGNNCQTLPYSSCEPITFDLTTDDSHTTHTHTHKRAPSHTGSYTCNSSGFHRFTPPIINAVLWTNFFITNKRIDIGVVIELVILISRWLWSWFVEEVLGRACYRFPVFVCVRAGHSQRLTKSLAPIER